MQIFVKTFTGKTIAVNVEACDTTDSVKIKVHEKAGIPALQQRLVFEGKQLQDDCMLLNYNIRGDSTLYVMMCLRGGCCWFFSICLLMLILILVCMMPCTCGTSALVVPLVAAPLLILPCFCL